MIQRKQSIFLLIAFIVSVVCLCQPLGTVEPAGMGASFKLNNLFLDKGDSVDYSVCGLFFLFRNRKLQASLCLCNEFLLVAWYIVLGVVTRNVIDPSASFHIAFVACLPAVAVILNVMARAGILHDEKLVRAADRIR